MEQGAANQWQHSPQTARPPPPTSNALLFPSPPRLQVVQLQQQQQQLSLLQLQHLAQMGANAASGFANPVAMSAMVAISGGTTPNTGVQSIPVSDGCGSGSGGGEGVRAVGSAGSAPTFLVSDFLSSLSL
jgi:hypothetical protein